jgi:hypothetical protein
LKSIALELTKIKEAESINHALHTYQKASGQTVSLEKSEVCRNMPENEKIMICNKIGVKVVTFHSKYLGLPVVFGRSKKEVFSFVKDRVWKKINSWSGRALSGAGREVLIKSVLQSIPTYMMSIFLIPSSLGDDLVGF